MLPTAKWKGKIHNPANQNVVANRKFNKIGTMFLLVYGVAHTNQMKPSQTDHNIASHSLGQVLSLQLLT